MKYKLGLKLYNKIIRNILVCQPYRKQIVREWKDALWYKHLMLLQSTAGHEFGSSSQPVRRQNTDPTT